MLENLRQKSGSIVIWVTFAIIIAAFVLFFGPQAGPDMLGCGSSGGYALRVKGEDVSQHDWRFAMNGLRFVTATPGSKDGRRPMALDALLERELLAQGATANGVAISDDIVNESIAEGDFYIMGHRLDGTKAYFVDGVFDFELLERFAQGTLGLPSVEYLRRQQKRELLADAMRRALVRAPLASTEEAREQFVAESTRVSADYAMFSVADYLRELRLDSRAIDEFVAANEEALRAAWEREKARWTSEKARVRVRHIFIADKEGAPGAAKEAAERAATRLAAGESFAALAAEMSDDSRTAGRGGLLGWRAAGALGLGKEVAAAVAELGAGETSEPIEATGGYQLVHVEERSDAALGFEQKKEDLAVELAAESIARALAKRDAERALERAQTTPLAQLFERRASLPEGFDPSQLPPGLDLEELLESMPPAGGDEPVEGASPPEEEEPAGGRKRGAGRGCPRRHRGADPTRAGGRRPRERGRRVGRRRAAATGGAGVAARARSRGARARDAPLDAAKWRLPRRNRHLRGARDGPFRRSRGGPAGRECLRGHGAGGLCGRDADRPRGGGPRGV